MSDVFFRRTVIAHSCPFIRQCDALLSLHFKWIHIFEDEMMNFTHTPSFPAFTTPIAVSPPPRDIQQKGKNKRRRCYAFLFWTPQEWGAFKCSHVQFLLRWEEGGQVVQQARDRRRSEGEREEEIERQRKKMEDGRPSITESVGMDLCIPLGVKR